MTPEEAASQVAAIRAMVDRSRSRRNQTGDIYVAWGLSAILALAVHAGLELNGVAMPWVAWGLLVPAGAYAGWRGKQEAQRAVTYATRTERTTWMFTGLALAVLCFAGLSSGTLGPAAITPVICAVIAVAQATAAELYAQPELRWAALLFLVVSAVGFFLPWPLQFASLGVAILLGYVFPGIRMMRAARDDG